MTLKIRELIIRAEVSDSRSGAGDAGERETAAKTERSGPASMTDRFFDEDRQNENER